MPERPPDLELGKSTDRWMTVGIVLTVLLVLAFPAYRLYEPGNRAAARDVQIASLVSQGETLFAVNCASCHGAGGDGVDAPALNSQQFLSVASDEQITALIAHGVPGTAMAAYSLDIGGFLSSEQIEAVTTYLRSLEGNAPDRPDWRSPSGGAGHDDEAAEDEHEDEEPADDHDAETTTTTTQAPGTTTPASPPTTSSTTTTEAPFDPVTAFAASCASCHGADLGGGDGPPLGPTSHSLTEPDEHLFEAIWFGRNEMPPFMNLLTEEEIMAIIGYIRDVQAEG